VQSFRHGLPVSVTVFKALEKVATCWYDDDDDDDDEEEEEGEGEEEEEKGEE
jgi:hypothetical protein